MDALEFDYRSMLLAPRDPPCLSLYQPTHRGHPENKQDPIRFRNLLKRLEGSLQQAYANRDAAPLLDPFRRLAEDGAFWRGALDGLAVLGAPGVFKVYRLQRAVPEVAIVAASFHTKPLLRILQSADRYQILGIDRREARLFEGNRDAIDPIELSPEVPRSAAEVLREDAGPPERKTRVYGPAAPDATTRHGTDAAAAALARDTERFFRAVDRAVLEHYSRPSGLPLFLAALPEHQALFREVTRNPSLDPEGIGVDPWALSLEALRERAWRIVEPRYLERLAGLIDRFRAAKAKGLGADELREVAAAAGAGRIATLLLEAERHVPGVFNSETASVRFDNLDDPEVDDVLDDLGEHVLRTGGEVVIVPAERMPTATGLAATYRF